VLATHADLIAVWGADNVVRLPAVGAEFSQLPDGAKRVLTEVGLPREADLQFTRSDPEWVMAADGVHKYCKIVVKEWLKGGESSTHGHWERQ